MQSTCGPMVVRAGLLLSTNQSIASAHNWFTSSIPRRRSARLQSAPKRRSQVCSVRALLGQEHLADVSMQAPSFLDHLAARLTVSALTLADLAAPPPDAAAQAVVDAGAATQAAAEGMTEAAQGGGFDWFTGIFESTLKILDQGLVNIGTPGSYGFAIILLTCIVKAVTFPLTRQQMESTVSMQALAPRVKEIQERYKGKPQEEMQVEVARLYQQAGVNPLAGCLPTLVTIPVWIGLYRALSNAADEGILKEGWFWIPSLAGPVTAKAGGGLGWLFPLQNGAPPIGWHDALAYLVLPLLLVVSQVASQRIMSPPSDDPSQQQAQLILKFLPLMIGWFSLNVPSGLVLYWLTNNILTTLTSVWLKATIQPPAAVTSAGTTMGRSTIVNNVIDVEAEPARPSGKELGSRRSSSAAPDWSPGPSPAATATTTTAAPRGSGGKKKGEKFRALKAKEAAKKAARQSQEATVANAVTGPAAEQQTEPASVATQEKESDPVKVPDSPPLKDNTGNGQGHGQ
eukprot:jgi/Botrbrau1/681/Bobra.160_2s0005.1